MSISTTLRCCCFNAAVGLCALLGTFANEARAVVINWTPIGNPSNAADPKSGYGAVGDIYNIGTYDVTNSQYVEFLNAKDPTGANTLGLYDSHMGSDATYGGINFTSGSANGSKYSIISGLGNRPVNWVSWYDAIRFANWLNNGQGNGDTESGSYTLLGGTPTPTNGLSITRNPGTSVWLSSEDEWYKAAYYNPVSRSYFQFPTASNTAPTAAAPPGGSKSANYNLAVGHLTDVGAYSSSPSPYGTFDQGGNLYQWNEALIIGTDRGIRGGAFSLISNGLLYSSRGYSDPTAKGSVIGFRLASVPFLPGDFNRDGHVNAADIPAMLSALSDLNAYKTTKGLTDPNLLVIGNLNGSGALTNADLSALIGLLRSGGGSLATVSEPASIWLLAFALPGLAFAFVRRGGSLPCGMSRCQ